MLYRRNLENLNFMSIISQYFYYNGSNSQLYVLNIWPYFCYNFEVCYVEFTHGTPGCTMSMVHSGVFL